MWKTRNVQARGGRFPIICVGRGESPMPVIALDDRRPVHGKEGKEEGQEEGFEEARSQVIARRTRANERESALAPATAVVRVAER